MNRSFNIGLIRCMNTDVLPASKTMPMIATPAMARCGRR